MKKALLWGLAIIVALGLIGGLMDSDTDTPISNEESIVSTEEPVTEKDIQVSTQEPTSDEQTPSEQNIKTTIPEIKAPIVDMNSIPAYSGR